jgi:hypothetical protein
MSTYQYYEFQALDRPLTEVEQEAVSRLSSRVGLHPTRAVFVYNYSDFPGRAVDLLAEYQGTTPAFKGRLAAIRGKYTRRSALMRRLNQAGLGG